MCGFCKKKYRKNNHVKIVSLFLFHYLLSNFNNTTTRNSYTRNSHTMSIKDLLLPFAIWAFIALPLRMNAHKPDQSYIYFRVYENSVEGLVEIEIKDLNKALNLSLNPDDFKPKSDDDEVKQALPAAILAHYPRIQAYVMERVKLSSPEFGEHPMEFLEPTILPLELGVYVHTNFKLGNMPKVPKKLDIKYNVMFDTDPIQTGHLVIEHNWKAGVIKNKKVGLFSEQSEEEMIVYIFDRSKRDFQLDLSGNSIWQGFIAMIGLGRHHIFIGIDHILFLVALLLPAVVRRRKEGELASNGDWQPVDSFKDAFFYILKIVTLFTIAHSITLTLAALGHINISSRIVESIIAFSIALAAYHNIRPLINRGESMIAFAFGLFHGLGFASVLGEKGLNSEFMTLSLFGFNVGVEFGQILIICAIFPILFLLRKTSFYPKIIFYGSILLIVIAFYWVFERLFEIDLPVDDFISKYWRKVMLKLGVW